MRRPPPILTRAVATVAALGLAAFGPAVAAHAAPSGTTRQADFTAAAQRYGVPESVLLGVSYLESRWDAHRASPAPTAATAR
jgi:soluble lytic murein transglycosylase-like protein